VCGPCRVRPAEALRAAQAERNDRPIRSHQGLRGAAMATPTEESRRAVIAAREDLGDGLDDLTTAFRSAIDIPTKIRKNPLHTAGLAAGAAFLAVGGPKKAIRGVVHRIRASTRRPHGALLPK